MALARNCPYRNSSSHVQLQSFRWTSFRGVWLERIPAVAVATYPATVERSALCWYSLGRLASPAVSCSRLE